jgi:hypothetical protein
MSVWQSHTDIFYWFLLILSEKMTEKTYGIKYDYLLRS